MKSEVVRKMLAEDPDQIMPPPESNLQMSNEEIAIIAKWIDQGAEWKEHWSFSSPKSIDIPKDLPEEWSVTNEIDHFIYQKIIENGLQASPIADKEKLLRRVYLDLTGLPPTITQLDDYLADTSEDAYEHVVDELLSSETCAERLTMEWLDVARYADSHGLHADGWRSMWPWRDWVIQAFNQNMPYDQFVTEQLAGDLLENPSTDQIIATAFNRNHTMTAEGGAIDEEWRLSYVFDRAETFSTAFLGLTMNCAKCHDHKYDPISQDEYYQMTAFFNNVRELGMTGDDGNYGPTITLANPETQSKIDKVAADIEKTEIELGEIRGDAAAIEAYINGLKSGNEPEGLVAHYPLDQMKESKNNDGRTYKLFDQNKQAKSYGDVIIWKSSAI